MSVVIRKIVTVVEETLMEMGKGVSPPTRRAAAIAVIENPFAGRYVEDLSPLIAIGEELGELLAEKAVAALGIADAVTVLARTAAEADAAATIIANAVDLPGHPAVIRCPADEIQPDSDLGARLVTRDVGFLEKSEIAIALEAGAAKTRQLLAGGLIEAAVLHLCGETCVIGVKNPDANVDCRPARQIDESMIHA